MPFYVGGTAGMRNRGDYAAGTTYFPNDMVQYQGSTYLATVTTTGNLPTNASFWTVLAAAGQSAADLLQPTVYTPGMYYSRRTTTGIPGPHTSNTSATLPLSRVLFVPNYLARAVAVNQIGINLPLTPTAGCVIRLGSYTMNATTNAPDTLISDYGTVSPTTANLAAISVSVTLPKGWIYFALAFNSIDYGGISSTSWSNVPYPVQGWSSASFNNGAGLYGSNPVPPMPVYVNTTNTTAAALSASAGATATWQTATINANLPDVFFRAA